MSTPTPDETLLGLLALEPQHGYQLLEHFRDHQRLGAVWDMSTSQIYAVLNRLERLGYIVGRQVEVENAPIRTCYALTASGQNALNNWLHEPLPSPSIRRVRVEFISRLYIARLLGIPAEDIIERQRATCARQHHDLLAQREQGSSEIGQMTIELIIAQLEAILSWLDHITSRLQSSATIQ